MREQKRHQPPMSIEDQIENLESLGLVVKDKDKARKILNDISYFRLIKAFSLRLKPKNGKYIEGISFEQILDLYLFNAKLRQLIFPEIEKIEVNLRCRMANHFSQTYGVLGYKDEKNFVNACYYNAFMKDINSEIQRNSKAPFVKNFCEEYEGGELPFYALVEILSFGTLSKIFKNMKNKDKKIIAQTFGVGYTYLESWLENLSYVRNICAHYGRLYNAKFSKTPKLYKEYQQRKISNNRTFGTLVCLKHLLFKERNWKAFADAVESLFDEYEVVDKSTMGFPEDWKEVLNGKL